MARCSLLFDDRGNVWPGNTHDLRRHLGCDLTPEVLSAFVVRNLGFVEVSRITGGLRIRLRPEILSATAFQTLMHWLSDQPQHRVILTTVSQSQTDELVSSPAELRRKLNDCLRQSRWRAGKQFHRTLLRVSALQPDSPLREFHRIWDEGRCLDPCDVEALCNRMFNGRFALSEATESNELIIRKHGRGYATYSNDYFSRCIGQRIEDDPDMEYGRWTAEAFRQALGQREPLLEEVEVAICGAGQPGRQVSYQRIIAPLQGRDGRRYLLSASVLKNVMPFELEFA